MTKWEPKVGEKCVIYDGGFRNVGTINAIGAAGHIRVKDRSVWYHPKQCRRLIKRERRRVWIDEPDLRNLADNQGQAYVSVTSMPRAVEFVEVRPK